MKNSVRLPAFAKVNLRLHVLGRRPDGYHELRTIFQSITLHDEIELSKKRIGGVELKVAPASPPASHDQDRATSRKKTTALPDQSKNLESSRNQPDLPTGPGNLVHRAIEAMRKELNYRGGIQATLTKQIPIARGLGGGSSDAAATIIGMLRLTGKKLPLSRAVEIAAELGADVPFFLFGGRALGVNRGDELYPLPDGPKYSVVVVSPNAIAVSTRDAFQWISSELTKRKSPTKISTFCALCWSRQEAPLANDFEGPVFRRHPRLVAIKRELLQQGAAGAALAGSGSAVFGLFRSPAQARRSAFGFPEDQAFVIETINREDYARIMQPRFS
jgi:4-diphosphocytidyl-2-C-methyl-D-erythritol kinase